MYKLLLDSDALIKISKADFLDKLVQNFDVIMTKDVYQESVTEGKKGFYQDADKIEKLVKEGHIVIIKAINKRKKPKQSFGAGETSVFRAYRKNNLIVTDDLKFALYSKKENMQVISSVHLLVILFKKNKLSKNEAYVCLERLKPFIRKELYETVKKELGG